MFQTFYFKSIRNLVVAFGSLFNNIYITREDSENNEVSRVKVPLGYGPKEKYLRFATEPNSMDLSKARAAYTLPRLAFEMTSINYDTMRKINSLIKHAGPLDENSTTAVERFVGVPYNIEFSLYVMTRNSEDGLQIIEQILPFFTPEFNVTVKMNSLNKKVDVPVNITSVSMVEDYEGEMDQRRSITHTLTFSAKTYIFGPEKTYNLIQEVQTNIFDLDQLEE
jgi:hypothetical protein